MILHFTLNEILAVCVTSLPHSPVKLPDFLCFTLASLQGCSLTQDINGLNTTEEKTFYILIFQLMPSS